MKKWLVIDTCVAVQDPNGFLSAFAEHNLVLHVGVFEELDGINKDKTFGRETARMSAREAIRSLSNFIGDNDVSKGIKTVGGGTLHFHTNENGWGRLPSGLSKSFDNLLLVTCLELKEKYPTDTVVLVTKDTPLRLKALGLGIQAEDYKRDKVASIDRLNRGFAELSISPGTLNFLHRSRCGEISSDPEVCGVAREITEPLLPHTCCWLHECVSGSHALALYNKDRGMFRLVQKPKNAKSGEILPKTDEQTLGLALAEDCDISLVTLAGRTGSGKTMMALLAGYRSLKAGKFKRLIVIRPTEEVGETLGFLPGTLEEKMAPRLWPIKANLAMIAGGGKGLDAGRKEVDGLIEKGVIEICSANFLRGGTINDGFVIIDEGQNFSRHVILTGITRAGQGTVVRITGDLRQVDSHFMDARSNGFAHAISVFPGQPFYGHLMFRTSVRSPLAEEADNLMS